MNDSILDTIKKLLGLENVDSFDDNLIIFINGALNVLTENGIGPVTGYRITSKTNTWSEFITNDNLQLFELCMDELYAQAIGAMKTYQGNTFKEEYYDEDNEP